MSARRPWLMLIGFVAVMASPLPWLVPAIVGVGLALTAARVARAVALMRGRTGRAAERIELGRSRGGRRVSIERGELAAHGLILGASGAGKTTTLLRILTEQISAGQAVVALDMKGSPAFASALRAACAAAGRPFKLWTPEGDTHWNPLEYGNPTELKDKLIATERFTEPHYQRAAERHLQLALGVLQSAHPEDSVTLPEVVGLMDPRRLPTVLRNLPRARADQVRDYLAALTPDQHSAIRGMQTRLALLTESHAGPFLTPASDGAATIDLRDGLAGDDVLLYSLNSSTYGKLASQLGTLVVQDAVSAMGRALADARGAPARPVTIAIDEFSGLGGDHVVALFARVREAGGCVLVATQEMADLDRAGRGLRDQIVGNTALKIVHRQDVPASAKLVAQMGGTERVWDVTRPLPRAGLPGGSGRGTRRQVERLRLDPNEIMALRTGEAALISKLGGQRPRIATVSPPRRRGTQLER